MIQRLNWMLAVFAVALVTAGCTVTPVAPTNDGKVLARIALLADPHVNRETNGQNAGFKAHFETAIEQVNVAEVDLVLIAGDLTQSGKPEEFADFKTHIRKFNAPVWYVPGNHDVGNKVASGTNGAVTPERVERYEKNLGPSWFAKRHVGVRVLGINSSILGSGFDYESRMWRFLDRELTQANRTPTFVLTHYPLFAKDPAEPGGVYWNIEPSPRARLVALLRQGGAKGVLSGHLHRPLENGLEEMRCIGAAPVSFGLPAGKQPEGWSLLTILANGEVRVTIQSLVPR